MMPVQQKIQKMIQKKINDQTPLFQFNEIRSRVLTHVVSETLKELTDHKTSLELDDIISSALYSEKIRLKKERMSFFTYSRNQADRRLWKWVHQQLTLPASESPRVKILERIITHYAEEIGGHFEPGVYRFATQVVPLLFNWLLNAASVKQFLPWKVTQLLDSKLSIEGESELLHQLSQKGTVLLVPTHQSNIDSLLIGYVIYRIGLPPFAYGAGLNLFTNPVLNFFMSRLGAYTVDRKKNSEIYKQTLKNYSTMLLSSGIHSVFFPGGGRSRSGAIESKLKLGLLGTALTAQIQSLKKTDAYKPVFIVPMTTSYHFVLEASSLIEDYLIEVGKHKYLKVEHDDSFKFFKMIRFFWKIFKSENGITVRIGQPLDVFGNTVDHDGNSLAASSDQNPIKINPLQWIRSHGEYSVEPQRDAEYTRQLGHHLVNRFHCEHVVLSSQLIAFTYFEMLRKQYPHYDLFKLLRLSREKSTLPYSDFKKELLKQCLGWEHLSSQNMIQLEETIHRAAQENAVSDEWVLEGIRQLGYLHDHPVIKLNQDHLETEDMNLLYYYRNRLSGYGMSLLGDQQLKFKGKIDEKGFLE